MRKTGFETNWTRLLCPLDFTRAMGGFCVVRLTALFAATDTRPVREGLQWRVFEESPGPDGSHKLVAQSSDAVPNLPLPDGNFIVHSALGLAGSTKWVT